MNEYKCALFKAFIWTQGVEALVRECAKRSHERDRIQLDRKLLKDLDKVPLCDLIEALKPCVSPSPGFAWVACATMGCENAAGIDIAAWGGWWKSSNP